MVAHKQTIFERLGGVPAVRAAVTEFYERILDDARLSYFFVDANMSNLKLHQMRFFKLAFTEIPPDLDVAALLLEKHMRLFQHKGLKAMHFDMVAGHLIATLQHLGVPQDLINEAVGVVAPLRAVFDSGAKKYGIAAVVKESLSALKDSGEESKDNTLDESFTEGLTADESIVASAKSSPKPLLDAEAEEKTDDSSVEYTEPVTLAEQLGAPNKLASAVTDLYDRLISDTVLGPFFQGVDVSILKMHQVSFLDMIFSNKFPDMNKLDLLVRKSHQRVFRDYGINAEHFDMFMKHFTATFNEFFLERSLVDAATQMIKPARLAFEAGYFESERIMI